MFTRLKQSRSHKRAFIQFVRRHGFMRERDRIYIVITALQRGDFHKFKWSIGADPHLFALLPVHEEHAEAWFDDMVGRAEQLEQVAEGRWQFIHSSLVVSKRDKEGKQSGRGYVLSGLAKTRLAVDIALAEDDLETQRAFATLAEDEAASATLYNIDSFVPLYNSPLVMDTRSRLLDDPPANMVRPEPCEALLAQLIPKVNGRPALVLWGTRTAGGRGYLDPDVVAREFRHKTSKSLVRHLLDRTRGIKTCILAGEPLSHVAADIDLTQMWDSAIMKRRFGIECAFGRVEQEYVFFHLAKASANTLHIGMQSGNIEPLINNLRTNVICVNENSIGGAGLSNAEKISAARHKAMTRKRSGLEGERLPSNLYLPFNLQVLPSAIGELARRLMEKYEENVTMRQGLRRVLREICTIFTIEDEVDTQEFTIEQLFAHASKLLDARTPEERMHRATVDLLAADHGHQLEQILIYFDDKLHPERRPPAPQPEQAELRTEIQLLGLLAASCRPRVQFAIHVLNNELTAPVLSMRESSVRFAITHVERLKLVTAYKSEHAGEFTRLPKDPEPRLRALLDTLRAAIDASKNESLTDPARADVASIEQLLDGDQPKRLGNKPFPDVRTTEGRLRAAWGGLRPLSFNHDDMKELKPVLEILGL